VLAAIAGVLAAIACVLAAEHRLCACSGASLVCLQQSIACVLAAIACVLAAEHRLCASSLITRTKLWNPIKLNKFIILITLNNPYFNNPK
jgi:hypothetical protein